MSVFTAIFRATTLIVLGLIACFMGYMALFVVGVDVRVDPMKWYELVGAVLLGVFVLLAVHVKRHRAGQLGE